MLAAGTRIFGHGGAHLERADGRAWPRRVPDVVLVQQEVGPGLGSVCTAQGLEVRREGAVPRLDLPTSSQDEQLLAGEAGHEGAGVVVGCSLIAVNGQSTKGYNTNDIAHLLRRVQERGEQRVQLRRAVGSLVLRPLRRRRVERHERGVAAQTLALHLP